MVEFYNVIRIVAIVLKAVVLIPAIVFLVLLIRKAGFRQDPARRWISFAVAALGFFSTYVGSDPRCLNLVMVPTANLLFQPQNVSS